MNTCGEAWGFEFLPKRLTIWTVLAISRFWLDPCICALFAFGNMPWTFGNSSPFWKWLPVEGQNASTKVTVVTEIIVIRNHDLRTIFVIAGRTIRGTRRSRRRVARAGAPAASAASAAAAAALSRVLEQWDRERWGMGLGGAEL
jgi:hypothetical protein